MLKCVLSSYESDRFRRVNGFYSTLHIRWARFIQIKGLWRSLFSLLCNKCRRAKTAFGHSKESNCQSSDLRMKAKRKKHGEKMAASRRAH